MKKVTKESPEVSQVSKNASKIFGNKWVTIGSLILLGVFCFVIGGKSINLLIAILFAIFVHELGHFALMYKFGWRPMMIFLYYGAGVIPRAKPTKTTFKQEFYSVLAGPSMNAITSLVTATIFWNNPLSLVYVFLNSSMGVLNLSVGPVLDGGKLFNLSVDNVKTKKEKAFITLLYTPFILGMIPTILYFFRGNQLAVVITILGSVYFMWDAYKVDSLTAKKNGSSFIRQTGLKETLIAITAQYSTLAILVIAPIIELYNIRMLNVAIALAKLVVERRMDLAIKGFNHFVLKQP